MSKNVNCAIQEQIDFGLMQTNVLKSISKRFIIVKNVNFIHDGIFADHVSDWEEYLISRAITLAKNHNLRRN